MSNLGEFEQLILFAVLQLGDEAYGLAIRGHIEARSGRLASPGAIYTTLGRLEARGLVSSRVEANSEGRPGRPRKCYTLRPDGARALRESYEALQAMAGGLIPRLVELSER